VARRGSVDAGIERYYRRLDELAEGIVEAEAALRRLAGRAPGRAAREDTLAGADSLAAERRRLRAVVAREQERHGTQTASPTPALRDRVEIGPLAIDPASRRVTVDGEEVRLSVKEYGVLRALASDPTRVFTKEELLRDVWDAPHGYGSSRTLDSHASRLRRKLNGAPERHFVVNCWGIGYRLVEEMPEVAVG